MVPMCAFAQVEVPRVQETVDVRIVELDVLVTDRSGNPVHGLIAADFVITEDGQPRTISNLAEFRSAVGSTTTPSPADSSSTTVQPDRPRQIVLFFDTLSTDAFSRTKAVRALTPLLETIHPSDEVMIVTWNRKLEVLVPPTSDRARLHAGLKKVPRGISRAPVNEQTPMVYSAGEESRRPSERRLERLREDTDAVTTARTVRALLSRLSGASGRKFLFIISDGLALGGERADARAADDFQGNYRGMLAEVARDANAAGVTFYTMQPMGLVTGSSVTDEDAESHEENLFNSGSAGRRQDRASQAASTLIMLARQTGGRFITNSNDLGAAVRLISRDMSNYYSIAWTAAPAATERERKLVVRVKDRDLRVRSRRSLIDRGPDTQLAQQMISNFMFPVNSNALKISLRGAGASDVGRRRFAVPVDVVIPYSTLAFISEGEGFVAEISLFVAASDQKDNVSEVRRFDRKVVAKQTDLKSMSKLQYVYGLDIDLQSRTGSNRVTVGVVDQLSKVTGFAVLEIPPPLPSSRIEKRSNKQKK